MPPSRRRIKRKKKNRHIMLVLLLIIAGIFLLIKESDRDSILKKGTKTTRPNKITKPFPPAKPELKTLPRISIVMDDLGPNKKAAQDVLDLKIPLTLSILPQEVYSKWIAEEGHRLGLDIIGHIPMEAKKPLRLGNGGLYRWMTKKEIIDTLKTDFNSIPHIMGISTHMGSAFTEDKRVMNVMISELKKHRLFLLDSFTTPKSVGMDVAKSLGIKAIRRDVFLDDSSNPAEMKIQWNRMLKIAAEKDFAVVQAHPRKNTIAFLKKALSNNNEIKIVQLSELINE
jgi:polysaccharide deacetylase 2 family uncharacterized protein YibQ